MAGDVSINRGPPWLMLSEPEAYQLLALYLNQVCRLLLESRLYVLIG